METKDNGKNVMEEKLLAWLGTEGYPLEFFTAHTFKRQRYSVSQSYFVKDSSGKVREIDVLASTDTVVDNVVFRIIHIVECKWSKDKPWLLFRDETRLSHPALVAQMIGNDVGQAVTWLQAGDLRLQSLSMFKNCDFTFSGRQAFTKDADRFYQSAQSVISNSVSVAKYYTRPLREARHFPVVAICLPLIVVEGDLYEVTYSGEEQIMHLNAKKHSRLRWLGNADYNFNAIIDVVAKSHLKEFLAQRTMETQAFANACLSPIRQLLEIYNGNSELQLDITPGARGMLGYPPFITNLLKRAKIMKIGQGVKN